MHLLIDLTDSSHTRARTGIQRVAREIYTALGSQGTAVCFDPYQDSWRQLQRWELENLDPRSGASVRRSPHWPLQRRLRSRLQRGVAKRELPDHSALLVPEVFSRRTAGALRGLFCQIRGPRIAIFHDAFPLKLPELSSPSSVARFPGYLRELLEFDGVVAVSEDSRASLEGYWRWLGVTHTPQIITLPHGITPPPISNGAEVSTARVPVVLSVGTLEGRKNIGALLDAADQLWTAGKQFQLRLVGLVSRPTGVEILHRIRQLEKNGRPIVYRGPATDDELEAAYAECAFTVYPSLAEGFGLPVVESLVRGKPCICSARGALGEISRAGGCLALDLPDANALAPAMAQLLENASTLAALKNAATARKFKSWSDYVRELTEWIQTLARR